MSEPRKSPVFEREVPISRSTRVEFRLLIRGLTRLAEFGGVFEPRRTQPADSPDVMEAMAGDWERIGGDLRVGIHRAAEASGVAEAHVASLVNA